ncbi:MAG: hypothetical protein NPMRTH4_1760013 [Nitrosopumilales archaeon]|nr:MAG: hypothetical protein NPMRTH4_1760013 [Nitrosopumilales archaeon]
MDKNPNQNSLIGFNEAKKYLEKNTLNSVLCKEPFVKAAFLSKLIEYTDVPIFYLDFDLLYSGYVNSNMLPKKFNVSLFSPSKNDWNYVLKKILMMISNEKSIIIIDSLNGLYNLFDGKNIGRFVNTCIMLLVFVAKESGSSVLVTSLARKKDGEGWVLSPTGRRIVDSKIMTNFYLKKQRSGITIDVIGNNESIINSIKLI